MTNIPRKRLDGYRWLVEAKKFELIKLGRGSKTPVRAEKGWAARTKHRSFLEIRFNKNDNAGVLTGRISGIIVLDIDNEVLFPKENEIPVTFTVKTYKGFHHYFKLPDDGKKYGNRAFKALGYDIRGDGGYVVAPWSKHPDGPIYKIINEAELSVAPEWLLPLSEKKPATPRKTAATRKTRTTSEKRAAPTTIIIPGGVKILRKHKQLIETGATKGGRSERIWYLINDLVKGRYSDDEIRYLFEKHPAGIGEKYFEKETGRATWLQGEIDRARKSYQDRHAASVKAEDQGAVEALKSDILTTFRTSYKVHVSNNHEQVIESVVNLFISMYEGSVAGWYALPLPVGAGKTQTVLHFIKFLHTHDTARSFPISVAFEKITEIEDAAKWLTDHGVPNDFFKKVHHKVSELKEVFKKLKDASVILHTHQKLKGSSYEDDYFKYKGKPRKLLIFDESMLNSMISSDLTQTVVARIDRFLRAYDVDPDFRVKIPEEVYQFFKELRTLIDAKEKELRVGPSKEVVLPVDSSCLDSLDYPKLVSVGRMIEAKLGETDLFRDVLLIGISSEKLRRFSLIKEHGKPAFFACKELLSDSIENLITTDASRKFRRLFKYTNRDGGKQIRIYEVGHFRWNDELYISGIKMKSGQGEIKKAFADDGQKNEYLAEIVNIVKSEHEAEARETAQNNGVSLGKREYLFFHSKQIPTLPYQVREILAEEGLIPMEVAKERLNFVTFGRENATNKYSNCDIVIFIGLHHKPAHAIKALLSGEGFRGDSEAIKRDVQIGELVQQLQQGIGRGQVRDGEPQGVFFFHPDPLIFAEDLERAFPFCSFEGSTTFLPTGEDELAMEKEEINFKDLSKLTPGELAMEKKAVTIKDLIESE